MYWFYAMYLTFLIFCNIMTYMDVRNSDLTWNEYVNESQDSKMGRFLMKLFYISITVDDWVKKLSSSKR